MAGCSGFVLAGREKKTTYSICSRSLLFIHEFNEIVKSSADVKQKVNVLRRLRKTF
jgi:hypothetical protein